MEILLAWNCRLFFSWANLRTVSLPMVFRIHASRGLGGAPGGGGFVGTLCPRSMAKVSDSLFLSNVDISQFAIIGMLPFTHSGNTTIQILFRHSWFSKF